MYKIIAIFSHYPYNERILSQDECNWCSYALLILTVVSTGGAVWCVMWVWGPRTSRPPRLGYCSEEGWGGTKKKAGLDGGTLTDCGSQDPRGAHAVNSSLSSLFLRTKAACLSWKHYSNIYSGVRTTSWQRSGPKVAFFSWLRFLLSHLLLEALDHGCQVGVTVLLDLIHLHLEFLLSHLAEVAVLFHGL